jgi:hypothetical protein
MKRAIFRTRSIDVCIEHRVLATPISPDTLEFTPGEDVIVATTKAEAAMGEYQFLFVMGDYRGEYPELAAELFGGRDDWKYIYNVESITSIMPFSLADVVAAAGSRGPEVEYQYKGQTQHHRIIRTILPEDEALWRSFVDRGTEPVESAAAVVDGHADEVARRAAAQLSPAQVVSRLRRLSSENGAVVPGRSYRAGKSQKRNRTFVALVKALYAGRCQVCGETIANVEGTRYAIQIHHLEPWDGDHSDRLDNVICVCPNDHHRFELGLLEWRDGSLYAWTGASWEVGDLACDTHLAVALTSG